MRGSWPEKSVGKTRVDSLRRRDDYFVFATQLWREVACSMTINNERWMGPGVGRDVGDPAMQVARHCKQSVVLELELLFAT